MKTLLEILDLSADFLKKQHTPRPRREAEELIADVLGVRRLDLYLQFERPLANEELEKVRLALKRRAAGEPVQYISGVVAFAGALINVSPAVLIPRPETEILVEKIAGHLEKESLEGRTLWDLCTGSGCIGIALKKRFPRLTVILSDLSQEALALARGNAERNGVDVELRSGDLFAPFAGQHCDYLVSNPPYIREDEYPTLSKEVHAEPKCALVGGSTGLEFYERIAACLRAHLRKAAWFEIGAGQGESIQSIFEKSGFAHTRFEADWAGHDRFFYLEIDSTPEVS